MSLAISHAFEDTKSFGKKASSNSKRKMVSRQHLIAENILNHIDIIKVWKYFLRYRLCISKVQKRLVSLVIDFI